MTVIASTFVAEPIVPGRSDINSLLSVEEQLVHVLEALLEIGGVGADDNFFDLGGTSLQLIKLIAEISRQFNVALPLSAIIEAPTARSLGQLIDAASTQPLQDMLSEPAADPYQHLSSGADSAEYIWPALAYDSTILNRGESLV